MDQSRPGTFQQYVISQADYVTPIPDGLKSEDAAVSVSLDLRCWGLSSLFLPADALCWSYDVCCSETFTGEVWPVGGDFGRWRRFG